MGYAEVRSNQTFASLLGGPESKKQLEPQFNIMDIFVMCHSFAGNDVKNNLEHFQGEENGSRSHVFKHKSTIGGHLRPPVILVADDEVAIRNIARFTLEEAGYFVLTAGDGEQALNLSRGFDGKIHVLVSDMVMPKLDGMALRKLILRERPTVKVLLMSGSADRSLEGVAFLPKPFAGGELEKRVQELAESAMFG